jgi:hypothetical protein
MMKRNKNLYKMKHLKTVIIGILLIPFLGYAKIHTVDNNPGNGAMFSTIASAVSAASSGDTIIVMPSVSKYDGIYLSKKLFVYSRNPFTGGVDADRFPYTDRINFYSGSAGSKVSGFHLNPGGIDIQESNVELSYNYLVATYVRIQGVSHVNIINNVFIETKYHGNSIQIDGSNNILRNNYFATVTGGNYDGGRYCFIFNGNSTNLIINNLFSETMTSGSNCSDGGFIFFKNCNAKIYNNIMWSNVNGRTRFDTLSSGSYYNNITYASKNKPTALSGTGNFNDTFPSFETTFSDSKPPYFNGSEDFRLQSGTVGKNAGTDSTDIGLYGAGHQFSILCKVPGVPIFDEFIVLTPVIKRGGKLKFRLIARKPEN